MAYRQFIVSDTNPNDTAGGGGCVCDPRKQGDCHGPYVICFGNDMEDVLSPHVVIGADCVKAFYEAVHGDDILSAGEKGDVVASAEPTLTPESQRRESPQVESPDPRHDFDDAPKI